MRKVPVKNNSWGREIFKLAALTLFVALVTPFIETLLGRPTKRGPQGNPHAKPPFPIEMEAKPGYD